MSDWEAVQNGGDSEWTTATEEKPVKVAGPSSQRTSLLDEVLQSKPYNATVRGLSSFEPGIGLADFALKNEELIPLLGQLGGGALAGLPGATGGAAAGNTMKQTIQMLKGKRKDFSAGEVGTEAALTAALEGAFRLPAFLAFKRVRAAEELKKTSMMSEALGKLSERFPALKNLKITAPDPSGKGVELGLMKDQLSKLNDVVAVDDVLTPLQDGMKNITVGNGPQWSMLNKWKIALNRIKDSGRTHLTGKELIDMEDSLGNVAKFAKDPNVAKIHVPNPKANQLAKNMRNFVSSKVNKLAVDNGFDSFPQLSKEVSRLIKISDVTKPSFMRQFVNSGLLGGGVGALTGNAGVGLGTSAVGMAAQQPVVRRAAYSAIERTGLGRGLTLAATQGARDLLKEEAE